MAFQFVNDHREYLKREFQARAQRRPLYSQRAFARDIGLSPSSLTDYFKGQLRLSSGRVSQLGETLKLNAEQKQHWIDLLDAKFSRYPDVKRISHIRAEGRLQAQNHSITMDDFKIISEWFHLAYLELIDMNAAKYSDIKIAAKDLAIPVKTLRVGVKRLLKAGFLTEQDGVFTVAPTTQLGDQAPSQAIREYHSQLLKKALQSLETHDGRRRYNSSTVVALPRAEVDRILTDIRALDLNFLEPYTLRSQNLPKDELFCLSIHFFDLLNKKEKS